jgi:hypothetical protein
MADLGTIGTATGSLGLAVGITLLIYKVLKNSKCRSRCCGVLGEVNIELEQPTHGEPLEAIHVEVPTPRPSPRPSLHPTPELKSAAGEVAEELKL